MPTHILAISGSLRHASSNSIFVRALTRLHIPNVTITAFQGLDTLPHFNPDLDVDPAPEAVSAWRQTLRSADAYILCSPEYIHGVPGSLKNAIDWIASSGEFVDKPVGLFNLSPRAHHAQDQLAEILRTASALLPLAASPTLSLQGRPMDEGHVIDNEDIKASVLTAIQALAQAVKPSL